MSRYDKITTLSNLIFPFFLIITTGIICYSSSFDASFNFDDIPALVQNESIRDLWNLKAIWQGSKTRFFAHFTFALNYHIHDLSIFGYHLVNLIIHLSAALTVYWLVNLIFLTPELICSPSVRHLVSPFTSYLTVHKLP